MEGEMTPEERAEAVYDDWELYWRKRDEHVYEISDAAAGDLRARIALAIAQAEQAAETQWQQISTAPKDGTRVIVYWPGLPVVIGWYGPKLSMYGVSYGDAWGDGSSWFSRFETEPTAWMPLPPPPPAEVAEKGGDRLLGVEDPPMPR